MKSDAQIQQDDPAYEPRGRSPRRAVTVSDYAQKMAAQEAAYRVAGVLTSSTHRGVRARYV